MRLHAPYHPCQSRGTGTAPVGHCGYSVFLRVYFKVVECSAGAVRAHVKHRLSAVLFGPTKQAALRRPARTEPMFWVALICMSHVRSSTVRKHSDCRFGLMDMACLGSRPLEGHPEITDVGCYVDAWHVVDDG
jgi:hypothetical protein